MKKYLLLLVAFTLVSFSMNGQSKKFVLFEHFTQASCGPCATQNPAFELIRNTNLSTVHHIAYHTAWPGVDPMNSINATEVQNRVSYYGVSAVPTMHLLGKYWSAGPTNVSEALIGSAGARSAPVRLKSSDVILDDGTHEVKLTMIETGDLPAENLVLRVAVVEKNISYTTAPGTNGEREFPNVFRKFLTSADGMPYTSSGTGTEQTFTFTYEELDAYKSEELYIMAWLQDSSDGVIINSGSSIDPSWQAINVSPSLTEVGMVDHTFTTSYSSDEVTEKLIVSLESLAPSDWSQEVFVNGVSIGTGEETEVLIDATQADFTISVTPGESPAIVKYKISITNPTFPEDPIANISYRVISNITNLIVDHGGVATPFNIDYSNGLDYAGNNKHGILPITDLVELWDDGKLNEIENIFNNVSWTFPSITDDEVTVLSEFLDNGGNLFISGQDIGWDTWDPSTSANGTSITQAFYTDYLSSEYISDGAPANNSFTWSGDVIFDGIEGSAITDVHGGGNLYPDQISPIEPAVAIYHYGTNTSNIGAIRVNEDGHKVVYLGIDLGMIANETVRSAVVLISHDWFQGLISGTEYDQRIKEALGQSYPNPAQEIATIPLTDLDKDAQLIITDINGRTIHSVKVTKGQSDYNLNVSEIFTGNYYYFLQTDEGQSAPKKLQVIK